MADRLAVLIPLYNHAEYIGEALDSVLNQTRKADRIIVIDDGSPDNSLEVAKSYEKHGVEVTGRENRGAHATWHELVEKANDCEYCALLNSDDAWHQNRLEVCMKEFEQNPNAQVVATGLEMFDENSNPLRKDHERAKWLRAVWSLENRPDIDLCTWLGMANFIVTTSNVVAKRQALLDSPFQPYRFNHDYYFLAQSVIRGELAVAPNEITVKYRVHSTNTISAGPEPIIREMLRMNIDLHHEFGSKGFTSAHEKMRFSSFVRGSWDSVSSHDAKLMEEFAAIAISKLDDTEIDNFIEKLNPKELETFPNRSLINQREEDEPLGVIRSSGFAQVFEEVKKEKELLKQKKNDLENLLEIRRNLLESKWVSLAGVVGVGKKIRKNDGKNTSEKLEILKSRINDSAWLKLGKYLGSKKCRDLLDKAINE